MIVGRGKRSLVADFIYCDKEHKAHQVTRKMYVTSDRRVMIIWDYITGFVFTRNGYAVATKGNQMIKCKNQ